MWQRLFLVMYRARILEAAKLDEPHRKEDQWIASDPRPIALSGRVAPAFLPVFAVCMQQQLALASFTATSSVIWRTTKFAPLEGEQWRSTRWEHLTRECRNLVIHKCSLSTHASTWLFPHSPQPWGQWVQNWHPVKAARSITLMIFSIFAPFDYGCIAVLTSISSERQSFPMLSVYLANQHY